MITEWDKLVNRIKLEPSQRLNHQRNNGNQAQSVVAVKISLLVDCEGNPLTWTVESSKFSRVVKPALYLSYTHPIDILLF